MPTLTLNLEDLHVESFPTDSVSSAEARPKTYEPGCTMPELCGTT